MNNNTMNLEGFYIVNRCGYSLTITTIYNPTTGQVMSEITWDNDNWDIERSDRVIAINRLPENETVTRLYKKRILGIISIGDTIEIYKGRKYPKGTTGVVVSQYIWRGEHGITAEYWVLDNGYRVPKQNCRLKGD